MPKIFISYGRDESHGQNLATEAQQQLQAAGFEVFRDVIGLKPGDVWYSKLESELETSDLVVLVISERVRKSEWVHNEISMAKEIGLPIIPIIAEQVRMPLWLRHLQVLNFSTEVNWQLLFEVINNHLGSSPEEDIPTIREIVKVPKVIGEFQSHNLIDLEKDDIPTISDGVELLESVTSKNGYPPAPPGPFKVDCDLSDSCDEKPMHPVIIRARKAYWDNRLGDAAELYSTLIEREPTIIDYKGELANIFWRQGSSKKAAELYADIAIPMIEKGNGERVSGMVGFIGLFYPDSAADIRKLLVTNSVKKSRTLNAEVRRKKTIIRKNSEAQLREQTLNPHWSSNSGKDQYGQYADLEINQVTQRFRLIQPGTFQMGSPESEKDRRNNETLHQVILTRAFWLADTACTQALWLAVMGSNPSRFTNDKNNPVEQVSWDDVQEFIQALSLLKPDVTVQLPTEAQWEYACRAGTTTPFSFGENMTSEQVNYNGEHPYKKGFFQKKDLNRGKTLAVQSLPENPWGLYEMHGNVWEWCRDAYSGLSSEACTDPYNQSGGARVLRGGSWSNSGQNCRSASRRDNVPSFRSSYIGFRLSLVN